MRKFRCCACGKRLLGGTDSFPTNSGGMICSVCHIAYKIGFRDACRSATKPEVSAADVKDSYNRILDCLETIKVQLRSRYR